jgi:FHA domain
MMAKWFSGLFGKGKGVEPRTQWVAPGPGSKRSPFPDEDKTVVIGNKPLRREETAPGRTGQGNTEIVGGAHELSPQNVDKAPNVDREAAAIRAKPTPRLSWPARDAQGVPRWPAEAENMDKSREKSGGDETVFPSESGLPRGIQNDERTRLFKAPPGEGASSNNSSAAAAGVGSLSASSNQAESSFDPVVGWFVVTKGPGKGRSIEIGIGANSIGRDRSQKICLSFGDDRISRDRHAVLVYDPQSRRFFLQAGEVRNLTYLGTDVVLGPIELKGKETIIVGDTHLRFIPLCGPDFDWSQ